MITTGAPDAELPLLLGSPLFGVVKLEPSSAPGDGSGDHLDRRRGGAAPVDVVGSGPFMIESGDDPLIHMTRSPGSTAQLDAVDAQRLAGLGGRHQGGRRRPGRLGVDPAGLTGPRPRPARCRAWPTASYQVLCSRRSAPRSSSG